MDHRRGVSTSIRRRPPRALRATGALLAAASVLTACGGSDPVAAPTTTAGTGTSVQPRPDATTRVAQPAATTAAATTTTSTTAAKAAAVSPVPPTPTISPRQRPLPRGGTRLFPTYRLFGYSGAPGSSAFGRLGTGDLDARGREIEQRGVAWAAGRKVMPVFELITVIADSVPGRDGDYNRQVSATTINTYLAAARRHKGILLLDVQPGRDDFLTIAKQLEPWLAQPDVGLALDPEWAVEPGQVPGRVFGRTTGAELNAVAAYLDGLTRYYRLPQKAMVFHQVASKVVTDQAKIKERAGVVVIKSVDGIGSPGAKTATWSVLTRQLPASIHTGFKLFYEEDARHGALMTPKQVLSLKPQPEYVLFE